MQGVGGSYITKNVGRPPPLPLKSVHQVFTLSVNYINFFIGDASFIFKRIRIDYFFEKKSSPIPYTSLLSTPPH